MKCQIDERLEKLKLQQPEIWNLTQQVIQRESGFGRPANTSFFNSCISSCYILHRMHPGPIFKSSFSIYGLSSQVSFSRNGNFICASDSTGFVLWNRLRSKAISRYNIDCCEEAQLLDVKFVSEQNILEVFLAASGGVVYQRQVSPMGDQRLLRKISLSKIPKPDCTELALSPQNQNEVLCAARSGFVFNLDFRSKNDFCEPAVQTAYNFYTSSLASHPWKPEFVIGCKDYSIRFYDKRNLRQALQSVHAPGSGIISSCEYNLSGTEVLVPRLHQILVLSNHASKATRIHRIPNHLDPYTMTYFGARSEYIVMAGKRYGYIKFLHKSTAQIAKKINVNGVSIFGKLATNSTLPLVAMLDDKESLWICTPEASSPVKQQRN